MEQQSSNDGDREPANAKPNAVSDIAGYTVCAVLVCLCVSSTFRSCDSKASPDMTGLTRHERETIQDLMAVKGTEYEWQLKRSMAWTDRPKLPEENFGECALALAHRLYYYLMRSEIEPEVRAVLIANREEIIDDFSTVFLRKSDMTVEIWHETIGKHTQERLIIMSGAEQVELIDRAIDSRFDELRPDVDAFVESYETPAITEMNASRE